MTQPDPLTATVREALATMRQRHPREYADLVALARTGAPLPLRSVNLAWAYGLLGVRDDLPAAVRDVILAYVDLCDAPEPMAAVALGVRGPEEMP